jgi:hypothetical protein
MDIPLKRLGGWSLIIGTVVATLGYLAAGLLVHGSGDARYADSHWSVYNGIAVFGDVLIVLGLPVLFIFRGRSRVLSTIGYVGFFLAMVMLNVGEGVIEAFVKPYLVSHGGIPASDPTGLTVFETVALVGIVVGMICLGIGILRAHTLPWWVAVLFFCGLLGAAGLQGALALLPDYLVFIALFTVGVITLRQSAAVPAGEPQPVAA